MVLPDPEALRRDAYRRKKVAGYSMVISLFFAVLFIVLLFFARDALSGLGANVGLEGIVTDETGRPVANASVNITVREVDTNIERTVMTDETGRFETRELPPGDTVVRVNRTGYTDAVLHMTTYNPLGDPDLVYTVNVMLENGTGSGNGGSQSGAFTSGKLSGYCTVFILFFACAATLQATGLIALFKGKNKLAAASCIAGMLSIGMGMSTALSALAAVSILTYERNLRIGKKIEERE